MSSGCLIASLIGSYVVFVLVADTVAYCLLGGRSS